MVFSKLFPSSVLSNASFRCWLHPRIIRRVERPLGCSLDGLGQSLRGWEQGISILSASWGFQRADRVDNCWPKTSRLLLPSPTLISGRHPLSLPETQLHAVPGSVLTQAGSVPGSRMDLTALIQSLGQQKFALTSPPLTLSLVTLLQPEGLASVPPTHHTLSHLRTLAASLPIGWKFLPCKSWCWFLFSYSELS